MYLVFFRDSSEVIEPPPETEAVKSHKKVIKESTKITSIKKDPLKSKKKITSESEPTSSCFQSENIQKNILRVASGIVADSLWYNSKPLTDCSGIFHRVAKRFKTICPATTTPAPSYRSSRDLAKWYYEKEQLTIVQDVLENDHLIRPGAVMFYGRRNKEYHNIKIDSLTSYRGIEHVGVIVEVEKDSNGSVINYSLLHGRSPGKLASITNWHHRNPSRSNLPPFGNYDQQWVAIAPLLFR